MINDIDISYRWTTFNGSFMRENVYRQDAGPEVDAAWEALGVDCEYYQNEWAKKESYADTGRRLVARGANVPNRSSWDCS